MIHPELEELQKWTPVEYAAGYRARLASIPASEAAHNCWLRGWEDADTESLELARHRQVLVEGREDDYRYTWGLLFDGGKDARVNSVPFDRDRTEPWKRGWVEADITQGGAGAEW